MHVCVGERGGREKGEREHTWLRLRSKRDRRLRGSRRVVSLPGREFFEKEPSTFNWSGNEAHKEEV